MYSGDSFDRAISPTPTATSTWTSTPTPNGLCMLGGLKAYYAGSDDSKFRIVLVCDVYGYEDQNLRNLAIKIAESGFYVVVPDFFRGDHYVPNNPRIPVSEWMEKHDVDTVCEDLKLVCISLGYSVPYVMPEVGLIGFGWGSKVVVKLLNPQPVPQFFYHVKVGVLFDPLSVTVEEIKGVCTSLLVIGAEFTDGNTHNNDVSLSPMQLFKQFEDALDTKPKAVSSQKFFWHRDSLQNSHVEVFLGVANGWFLKNNLKDEEVIKCKEEGFQMIVEWLQRELVRPFSTKVKFMAPSVELSEEECHLTICVKQLIISGGFEGQDISNNYSSSLIIPVIRPHVNPQSEFVRGPTEFAIKHHNLLKKGSNLKLKEIIGAAIRLGAPLRYYVTFIAEDSSNTIRTYQTLVRTGFGADQMRVIVFRVKP